MIMFTKLKLTKDFSNIVFVLVQTAFWINIKVSNIGRVCNMKN